MAPDVEAAIARCEEFIVRQSDIMARLSAGGVARELGDERLHILSAHLRILEDIAKRINAIKVRPTNRHLRLVWCREDGAHDQGRSTL
jgi:hypothetical protein